MGYLQSSKCYLSGAIDNDHTGVNWRPTVILELTTCFGIDVFDPFSDPKQNKGDAIKQAKDDRDKQRVQQLISGFVRKDLGVIDRSDFIISRIGFQDVYLPEDINNFEITYEYFDEDDGGTVASIASSKPRRAQIPTTGTIHEIINSDLYHKPTLLVCEDGWWNLPSWLMGFIPTQYWFSSWNELYSYLQEVDDGKHQEDDRWHLVYGLV